MQEVQQGQNGVELMNIRQMYGASKGNPCSYCHAGKTFTWAFSKQEMFPHTYELMMERGWRRCGDYYYKNNMEQNCCKLWTIRQDVTKFHIKKDQKKTVKKLMSLCYQCTNVVAHQKPPPPKKEDLPTNKTKITLSVDKQYQQLMYNACKRITEVVSDYVLNKVPDRQNFTFNVLEKLKYFTSKQNSQGDYYCNYVMLLYGMNKKSFPKQYNIHNFASDFKGVIEKQGSAEDFLVSVQRNGYLVFTLNEKLKKMKSNEFQIISIQQHPLQSKPQPKVQKAISMKKSQQTKIQPGSILKAFETTKQQSEVEIVKPVYKGQIDITTDRITFGRLRIDIVPVEESNESWMLYSEYCKKIHDKEQKSMSSYINFLCTQGLVSETVKGPKCEQKYIPSWDSSEQYQKGKVIGEGVSKRMGCFHMKYYLEDKFIAVGVVDIVPSGLSSVYYFYDPEYKDYRLGVFSSVIEIEYVRYLSKVFPEFKYYYMGFYIQNNEKMSYKSDYQPCQLLCPQTYTFVEFIPELKAHVDKIISKQVKSVRLAAPGVQKIPDMVFQDAGVYINQNIKLTYQNQKLTLSQIKPQFFRPILKSLKQYLHVWGKEIFGILTFTL